MADSSLPEGSQMSVIDVQRLLNAAGLMLPIPLQLPSLPDVQREVPHGTAVIFTVGLSDHSKPLKD